MILINIYTDDALYDPETKKLRLGGVNGITYPVLSLCPKAQKALTSLENGESAHLTCSMVRAHGDGGEPKATLIIDAVQRLSHKDVKKLLQNGIMKYLPV